MTAELTAAEMIEPQAGVDAGFRQQVLEAMTTVLGRLLERSEPITEDMLLMSDLGMSSTLGLELMLHLEDELLILVDVEQMGEMKRVGDLADFIAGHSRPA